MADFATRNPDGTLDVRMHKGQMRAWESVARFLLVLAGSQGGKTVWGAFWLAREISRLSNPADIPDGKYDDYIASSATYPLLSIKMLPELKALFVRQLGWTYHGEPRHLLDPTGKIRILILSADSEGGLESSTAKAAWLDEWGLETVTIDKWEAVQRRLAVNQGRVLITTTPYALNWLKVAFYDRWKGGDADYDVVQFANIDNPAYPKQEYDRLKNTLPDWKFRMMCHGEFTRPAGLIYTDYEDGYAEFDESGAYSSGGNLVKAFSIPSTWLRDVGIDFGESSNCARLWIAEDPRTHYTYIYRDSLGGGLNGPEYAKEALEYKEPIRQAVGGARSEDERRAQWGRAGLAVVEPFIHDVEGGIDHGNALFKQRRAFVFDTCNRLRSELGTYSRELDAAGEPTAKISNKDTFHMLDAWRYVASRYPLQAPAFTVPKVQIDVTARTVEAARERAKQFRVVESEEYR